MAKSRFDKTKAYTVMTFQNFRLERAITQEFKDSQILGLQI